MRPLEGDAFLISAITAGRFAASRRNAAAHPRGWWFAARRSSSATGTRCLLAATVERVVARIVSRRVDILCVKYKGRARMLRARYRRTQAALDAAGCVESRPGLR